MGCGRALLCIIFPPLAVIDCGLGAIVLTIIGTILGWLPGVFIALYFVYRKEQQRQHREMMDALGKKR